MRRFTAIMSILNIAIAMNIGLNLPCNKELDGLLAEDPNGNSNAFLSCKGVGMGNVGFWERMACPNDMIFDFINQQCRTEKKKSRNPPTLNIAILNNSCAKNEICIGGTVCDVNSLKCLCPYGTTPQMDTLSCIKTDSSFINTDTQPFSFNSFSSLEKSPISGGLIPSIPQSTEAPNFFQPNNFKFNSQFGLSTNLNSFSGANNFDVKSSNYGVKNNYGGIPSNGDQTNSLDTSKWNLNMLPTHLMNGGFNSAINSFGIDFKPNPNSQQNFVFRPNTMNSFQPTEIKITTPHHKKVPVLARPGLSCRNNEVCIGGSICTLPMGLCLCPGDLEERDGECVLPVSSSIKITKVGIGALCSDLAECEHGSTCVKGRCDCLSPLVQLDGKCILKQDRKEVGPGELCDNGEVCVKGSVCDSVIPVCVCPSQTDLNDGKCVRTTTTAKNSFTNSPIEMTYSWIPEPASSLSTTEKPPTTQALLQSMATELSTEPNHASSIRTIFTASPTKSVFKTNHIKNTLGGSKQGGVGVHCSLNTDCMIGAYCNGNTNPPSCQCLSTHVNIEKRCQKVVYPGQIGCRSDLQCSAAYTGTTCIDRICVCSEGLKAVDQTCVPANETVTSPPGGSCSDARECIGGSACHEGWCICPDPTMIVQKGICIQPGPRPTVPPKTVSVYTTSTPTIYFYQTFVPATQTAPPTFPPSTHQPTQLQENYSGIKQFNTLSTVQGRKAVPGTYCGPLDICVGNSMCVDGLCVCPVDYQPSKSGRCEKALSSPATITASVNETKVYSRPGEQCGNGQICTGGSDCGSNGFCVCPLNKPMKGELCSSDENLKYQAGPGESCDHKTVCIKGSLCHSGQCRCQPGFIALSGNCVSLPMPTTPQMKTIVLAKPLESCDNGEQCEGGASCDRTTGICMCPPGQVVFGIQCQVPPTNKERTTRSTSSFSVSKAVVTQTQFILTTTPGKSTTECVDDRNCDDGKICVVSRCKCRPGYVDNAGQCEPLEEIELGERPVPISYAKHKVETMFSERIQPTQTPGQSEGTTKFISSSQTPSPHVSQRPRIVGSPIRRPKQKSKLIGNSGSGNYKTGSGSGTCPPGNDPTRDDSGKLIMCNGLEPNCPPRSYCYITSGGFATEEYNCCKSW